MTSTPIRPTPVVNIDAVHLSITQSYGNGHSTNVHLLENGDLGVMLHRGQQGHVHANGIPADDLDAGLLVLALGVDGDHDEVHFSCRSRIDAEELLGQAVDALTACREALVRIRKADGADERNAFELGRDYERGQQQVSE